jgi:hypothetical protein
MDSEAFRYGKFSVSVFLGYDLDRSRSCEVGTPIAEAMAVAVKKKDVKRFCFRSLRFCLAMLINQLMISRRPLANPWYLFHHCDSIRLFVLLLRIFYREVDVMVTATTDEYPPLLIGPLHIWYTRPCFS